jgi:hypothetical protein
MRGSFSTLSLLGLMASSPAMAAWPDDITLSNLDTWNGQAVQNTQTMRGSYDRVVQQLAVTVANKAMAPARTVGINGFDLALTSTIGFIESGDADPYDPSPWQRVHETGEPSATLWIPGISVRKGLPLSLEAGANIGYVAFSRQTVFGGYGRWAPLEGYGNLPDVALQLGYSGYLGNEELALSANDGSLTVGYSIPIGKLLGIHTGTVSPYAGVGYVRIHASPQMSALEQEALGIRAVSGSKNDPAYEEGFSPLTIHGGMRILSGDFQVLLNITAAPSAIVTLNSGLGFVF